MLSLVIAAAVAPLALGGHAPSTAHTIQPILTHVSHNEMAVSWGYLNPNASLPPSFRSRVRYGFTGFDNLTETAVSVPTMMSSPTENMTGYNYCSTNLEHHILHSVRLPHLPVPSHIYYCADEMNDGSVTCSSFHTAAPSAAGELRFYATADVGDPVSHNWTAIPQMSKQCQEDGVHTNVDVSLGVHIGDIAYNLDIAPRGDNYLAAVSTHMASEFPWMFAPGNHEADCNYTYQNYKGRFAAQNFTTSVVPSNSSRWYSFDKGKNMTSSHNTLDHTGRPVSTIIGKD